MASASATAGWRMPRTATLTPPHHLRRPQHRRRRRQPHYCRQWRPRRRLRQHAQRRRYRRQRLDRHRDGVFSATLIVGL